MNNQQIERISYMQSLYDEILDILIQPHIDIHVLQSLQPKVDILKSYYTSKDWLNDYEEDEKGNIPKHLKRSILSQDGIDHLLYLYFKKTCR